MIESIRLVKDDETGEQYRDYVFSDDATEWQKEAVREYGVESNDEVQDALDWRRAMDDMDNQQAARVMRGKHPTKDRDIGRPKNPGN